VVKINFPGSAARQTNFTANTNQSNESVTVVKINIPSGTNQLFFFPCDNCTLPCQLRMHRRKLIFTAVVEIYFYRGTVIFYHGEK